MRYMNKNGYEKSGIFKSNVKLWQRAISFITVLALSTNTMYSGGLLGLIDVPTVMTVTAEGETPSYTPTTPLSDFSGTDFTFPDEVGGYKRFVDYCYYYSVNEGGTFCTAHSKDKLTVNFPVLSDIYGFMGLGNASVPFAGKVTFIAADGKSNISLPRALFTHVSTDARLMDNDGNDITLEIAKNSSTSSPLLADYVHAGTNAANWKISVASGNTNSFSGVIGAIEANTTVNLTFNNDSSATVSNTSTSENDIKDVGELCGIMKTGSIFTVTDNTTTRTAVSSANGNAGSLVGTMEGTASLTLSTYPVFSAVSVTSNNGYAGGLVGDMASTATISGLSSPEAIGGTVTGATGAGGLFGHYTNSDATFDLKGYNITATVYAQNCGGVFGVLENNKGTSSTALALTINNTNNAGTVSVSSDSGAGCFGGIAGKYTTDDLKNSLVLDTLTLSATSASSAGTFGGAIGIIDSKAYINAKDLSITASGTALGDSADYFGGLIGKTSESDGVFADVNGFTLKASDADGFTGGGIVGSFKNGVLRLSGTTDMSGAKSQKGGQLVGVNDNVLTYGNGWTFKRSNGSKVDDLGTWGEVVRISDIESIVTLNSTDHTVTIPTAVTAISSESDFVKTALNIQLNNNQGVGYDCLLFTAGDINKRENLLKNTGLTIGTVSLAGTGITGFMRDGGDDVGVFTGTLTGSGTVTLAIGEKYGQTSSGTAINADTTGEGLGQIYAHPYNGLFAIIGNGTTGTGTVSSLEIGGTINVRNTINGMNIGGIAAVSQGSTSLSGITVSQTVNYGEPDSVTGSETAGKNIGGIIGLANGSDNGTISIIGTNTISTTFNISNNFKSWNALGAFIGKVTSPKFTINIAQGSSDTLTVSHTMVDNIDNSFSAGANTDGGGLIGYITSGTYSDRIINIDHLNYNNCTIVNKASSTAGGFLGYAWLDTNTTIDGLTVTNGTITNSTPNVGVMCYIATGKWDVNNLTITKMNLSGGAGTSLGMLVNKSYNGTKGLYLNVLKAGYTLTKKTGDTGITLPNSLGVYDELAAYSAEEVIKGTSAGVISINMNAGRHNPNASTADSYTEAKITTTGTYQNQLTSTSSTALGSAKYANPNSRYYYNLDIMSNSDAAQDIMLWSVNKYAASNISDLFVSSGSPFSFTSATNVKLSDYSYYPVYNVSGVTLSNINLDFGYSGIYALEGNSTLNTDSYNRDPSAQNQHYLMQSGLFINSAENSTITLDTVELSGDFLENSTYQGVLISGTASGSISIDGLVLDGITPKYNNAGTISIYDTGYLLVKNVNRADSTKGNIQINLSDISNTYKYTVNSSTATVAKSLFGDVYGPAISINIEDVKLDARSANGGLAALDTAYGTQNSIFTTATFFNSIKTSQAATMIYNYSLNDDWGTGSNRNVTYGREVSESVEYVDQENKYYNGNIYTDPSNNYHTSAPEYAFGSWRPYVGQAYTANQTADANGCFYREIKVNVAAVAYSEGCGTYNDPYIINSGAKLTAIAALINDASNTGDLSTVQLPKEPYEGVAANTTGARWCDSKSDHAIFTYSNTSGKYEWKKDETTTIQWEVEDVRLYLANAYYSISESADDSNGNIVLGSSFLGLGGTADTTDNSGKFAFRGVIVGNGRTIVNNSSSPFVNVSNGCVIKGLTINQNAAVNVNVKAKDKTTTVNAYFGYNSLCSYYGGMIGEIMGGDNIIDNSYVTYTSGKNVTLSGTYGTIVPVGGYVGVIVYGGLIFKNMTATVSGSSDLLVNNSGLTVYYNDGTTTHTDNNLAADTAASKAAIYVNPIVGRVINGYAVNEGTALSVTENGTYHDDENNGAGTSRSGTQHTLKNGKKHYSIADIKKYSSLTEAEKLNVTAIAGSADGNIDVPNAQALFVLSLITQSTAGTATEINGTAIPQSDTREVETSRTEDGEGNVTIEKEKTIVNTLPAKEYTNSLSYGTYSDSVYGMSHNADYSDVGTNSAFTDITDYSELASIDTAASSAIPYIIRHYTVGSSETTTTTTTSTKTVEASAEGRIEVFEGSVDDLDGKEIRIKSGNYYLNAKATNGNHGVKADSETNATLLLVTKVKTGDNAGKFTLSFSDNGITKYVGFEGDSRKMCYSTNSSYWSIPYYFNIEKNGSIWRIYGNQTSTTQKYVAIRNPSQPTREFCGQNENDGADLTLYYYIPPTSVTTTTITTTNTTTTSISYPARCLTSTQGFYDINLTGNGTYQLPDSYRGLGCVGMYDSTTGKDNKYSIKLNKFDGKGRTIDEDIYINKFLTDNYFNVLHAGESQDYSGDTQPFMGNGPGSKGLSYNHGIGLFDSVITKDASSEISNFTLTGSVNTEVYNNDYSAGSKEYIDVFTNNATENATLWLSAGGVCGWSTNGVNVTFKNIKMNDLTVNGSNFVGGLLGFSGIGSKTVKITVQECSADNISLKMTSASNVGSAEQTRNAMGAFVGKVQEGAVVVYGTEYGVSNSDMTKCSQVKIKSFGFGNSNLNYYASTGGLVGFAGHGCQAYDMKVTSGDTTINIGKSDVGYTGGIVGVMQPYAKGSSDCVAKFVNCTIENINVVGIVAGGIYGGKWSGDYVPYSIELDNCKMNGNNSYITGGNYSGGLVGHGFVYTRTGNDSNITIKDCKVSNYTITASKDEYAGGFIGYCDSKNESITCYIHDSSVEDCVIGQGGNTDYAGGAIGGIAKKTDNKIVGYNIKLDNVISTSSRMGAWVGYMAFNDTDTDIQFTGISIYGTGYDKNIGNWSVVQNQANKNASFVFADYDGACESYNTTTNLVSEYNCDDHSGTSTDHVEMPKYPYVNVNPQSSMGIGKVISGDGAVLRSSATSTSEYCGKTAEKTIALKLYEDSKGSDSRRYSTFADDAVYGSHGISYYMQRTTTDDGDRISNYYEEKGYKSAQSYDNFACVVIANNKPDETTALINRYAQLVTNTTTDYAGTNASNNYFDIVVRPCVLRNGAFIKDTSENAAAGLTYSNGQFNLNSSGADSMKSGDTFTLVDIQFKDPLDTNKIAYHLYIPVYTIKEIEVSFSAAVMNGANSASYNSNVETLPYGIKLATTGADTHVDNLNTWFTTYIRYTYSHDDLQALLDSGNLNWNHNKYFYIDKYGNNAVSMLPDSTYMILIDPNGEHDKKYQVTLNSTDFAVLNNRITFDLTKFEDSSDNKFKANTFNELIAMKITATTNGSSTGKYKLYNGGGTPSNTGSTHYVYIKAPDGTPTYYEYVGNGGTHDLTLNAGDVYENYYISMYVPGTENDSHLYGYYIRTPETFEAPSYSSGTNNAVTKSAKVNCVYVGADYNNTTTINRQVYIGNVFEQITELTVRPHDQEIDGGNHTLNIYATTTITPRDNNVYAILKGINPDIYHSFNVFLDRKGENGVITNEILGLEHDISNPENIVTDIQAWYSIGTPISTNENANMSDFTIIEAGNIDLEKNYINVTTGNCGDSIFASDSVTIYSRIRLDFDDYESEFPQKVASDTGVSVRGASNLAYESSSLAFSNMSEPMEEPTSSKHIYYRQSLSTASLKYYATTEPDSYDSDGLPSENYSRLGVSGKYSMNTYMPVDTTAQYNVQNIESSLDDANSLDITLSLQKKTDSPNSGSPYTSASYQNVTSMNSYWGAVERDANNDVKPNASGSPVTKTDSGTNLRIQCGSYDQIVPVSDNTTTFTYSIPKEDLTNNTAGYKVDENGYIYIYVGFNAKTGSGFTEYANYKVNITAKLQGESGDITGSYADDYLIYTNAKVNHDFLKHGDS